MEQSSGKSSTNPGNLGNPSDASWLKSESKFIAMSEKIRTARTYADVHSALSDLFAYGNTYLGKDEALLFREMSVVLGLCPQATSDVFAWMKDLARNADVPRRSAMATGILQALPEEPVSWAALEILFRDWWFDESTRWAVYDAYSPQPDLLWDHLKRFADEAGAGARVPAMTAEEEAKWKEYCNWFAQVHAARPNHHDPED